jgi:hypothetical protein
MTEARKWSEPLVVWRNAIEHQGWTLQKFAYLRTTAGGVEAKQPEISGQPVAEFVEYNLDRLCCFVEDVSAHCLQLRMSAGISVTEIPRELRLSEMPERFRLALRSGGTPIWTITTHLTKFGEI